jgi:hypothetical protein
MLHGTTVLALRSPCYQYIIDCIIDQQTQGTATHAQQATMGMGGILPQAKSICSLKNTAHKIT